MGHTFPNLDGSKGLLPLATLRPVPLQRSQPYPISRRSLSLQWPGEQSGMGEPSLPISRRSLSLQWPGEQSGMGEPSPGAMAGCPEWQGRWLLQTTAEIEAPGVIAAAEFVPGTGLVAAPLTAANNKTAITTTQVFFIGALLDLYPIGKPSKMVWKRADLAIRNAGRQHNRKGRRALPNNGNGMQRVYGG